MKVWQTTQTRGLIKAIFLILMTSAITMGSSIASPTTSTEKLTSEESTSCRKENPREENEESQASQIGKSTTEVLKSLNRILEVMAEIISEERSSHSTQQSEEQTTRKQNNSF